jgi:hypothetical protein
MGAIVMVAANEGINHETSYRHEHEKKKAWERHYKPLPPAYAIRRGRKHVYCSRCILGGDEMPNCDLQLRTATEVDT